MGIAGIHAIPMMITCMLQGTLCDTGIPRTLYGENICSVFLFSERRHYDRFLLSYRWDMRIQMQLHKIFKPIVCVVFFDP